MDNKPELSNNVKAFLDALALNDNFKVELRYDSCVLSPECPYCHSFGFSEPYTLEIDLGDGEPITVEGHRCLGCETIFAENVRLRR